jgi:hypothetical protein
MNHKKLILLIVVSFVIFTSSGQKTTNSLTNLNLEGGVKSATERRFDASEGASGEVKKMQQYMKLVTSFNENGNMLSFYWYESGNLERRDSILYDSKNQKTEEDLYDGKGSLQKKIVHTYDDKGNETESSYYLSDKSLGGKDVMKYDDDGNKTELKSYDAKNKLVYKETYKYDSKGNNTEKIHYNADGKMENKYIMTYDDNGNKIQEDTYDSEGEKYSKELIEYDEHDNMKEHYLYGGNILFSINTLYYKYTYEYTYDSTGNWTKYTEFENGYKPLTIFEREIVYY